MTFKQSPVVFNEENHTYTLEGKRLLGITGLIHSILGLGVYPDADAYTKDHIIPRAGSRGKAVHHAIQTYDLMGICQTTQVVTTKYGCKERNNIEYVDETWDVSAELSNYIRHLEGFKALANELTVSDNIKYASQIDNVWLREETNGIWLVDTKTNNLSLYPTCGYYNARYFRTGVAALREYLSWQLSIYAELFEAENPGLKVEGLACNWLRKNQAAFWVIDRKPSELVRELLSSDYHFTANGPVYYHPNLSVFGISSKPEETMPVPKDAELPILPQDIINTMADLLEQEKVLKANIEKVKTTIRTAMEENGVKSWDSGRFKATIAADSERSQFDAARFKADYPELYKQYTIRKTTKGGFTIK